MVTCLPSDTALCCRCRCSVTVTLTPCPSYPRDVISVWRATERRRPPKRCAFICCGASFDGEQIKVNSSSRGQHSWAVWKWRRPSWAPCPYGLCGRNAAFRKLMAVGIASVWSEIRERVHRVLQDYGKGAGGRGEPKRRCFMPSSFSQSSVTHHTPSPITPRRWGGSLPGVAPATSTLLDWVRRKPVTGYPQSLAIARPRHLSANANGLFRVKAHSGFSLNEHR